MLFLGSSISGGDGVYALRLDLPGWETAFETMQPVGRLAEVETNLKTLNGQVQSNVSSHRLTSVRPKRRPSSQASLRDELQQQFLSEYPYYRTWHLFSSTCLPRTMIERL